MAERKFAWPARADNTLIGKDIQRIDGVPKGSGQAKYTADINTPGTLDHQLRQLTTLGSRRASAPSWHGQG